MVFYIPFFTETVTQLDPFDLQPPKPYQQAFHPIPHLFTTEQVEYSTEKWFEVLDSARETYESCKVVSITTAKALGSSVFHEFVQFIVEDTNTNSRTRVFSDRTDSRTPPDRVIVGRDWASPKNPSGQTDMPMPLMSLTFMPESRPCVVELAEILKNITLQGPKYGFFTKNCWWYAKLVFETAKACFATRFVYKEWPFVKYANDLAIWHGFFTSEEKMKADAYAFKKQNVEKYDYQVNGDVRHKWSVEGYLEALSDTLKDEEAQKGYREAMQLDSGAKLDSDKMISFLNTAKETSRDSEPSTEAYDKATAAFVHANLNGPDAEVNREAFEEAWQRQQRAIHQSEQQDPEEKVFYIRHKELYWGAMAKQRQEFDRSVECFVGGVLRRMNEAKV
ncbi:hypothetical protein KCU61_g1520, partial [Aureobasidium melanogenum]